MSERIKELAEQALKASMTHDGVYRPEGYANSASRVFAYKFAELIVQECAEVIQKEVSMKYKDGGETEEFMGGHYAGSVLARVVIKQHFGVEE